MLATPSSPVSPRLAWVAPGLSLDAASTLEVTREMRNLGWHVDLITNGPAGKYVIDGVEVLGIPSPNVYLFRHVFFHLGVIGHIVTHWRAIQVVLLHQPSVPWLLPLRLLNAIGEPHPIFVMDTRTVPMESPTKATLKDRLRGRFHWIMTHLGNLKADGATAITQRMADLVRIPPGKLWGTWPSGVNLQQFAASYGERRWPGPEDRVIIIYIGVLHYERNLMTLCKAVVLANQKGLKFRLLLVGEGTEKRDLEAFAAQYPEAIQVVSKVPHHQIPGVLAKAHVGALPFPDEDKYRASSPVKLFEYMGAGMPILATRIVCHSDVIGKGEYVFWAENAEVDGLLDALQRIWCRKESMPSMGMESSKAAVDWSYAVSAKRLSAALSYGLFQHARA